MFFHKQFIRKHSIATEIAKPICKTIIKSNDHYIYRWCVVFSLIIPWLKIRTPLAKNEKKYILGKINNE